MSVLDEITGAVGAAKAFDYILLIEGFSGGGTPGQQRIEVLSFSWGMSSASASTRTEGQKVFMQDISFAYYVSEASPVLRSASASGAPRTKAVLTARKPGSPADVLRVTLEDCLITSYRTSGREDAGRRVDEFKLSFPQADIEYRREKPDGSLEAPVHAGWDLTESKV
jgi:type VI secretion system secreted protein Hcp